MAEFKKASEEFQESVRAEMKDVEKAADVEEVKKLARIESSGPQEAGAEKPAEGRGTEHKNGLSTEHENGEAKGNG